MELNSHITVGFTDLKKIKIKNFRLVQNLTPCFYFIFHYFLETVRSQDVKMTKILKS